MLKDTTWTRSVVGGTAGVTLALALAVVGGVVPSPDQAAVAPVAAAAALDATAPVIHGAEAPVPPEDGGAEVVASADASPESEAAAAAPAEVAATPDMPEQAPAEAPAPSQPAVSTPAAAPGAPAAPVAHTAVPRRQPSPAEVQQALDGLAPYVDSVFTPTAAQVHEAGDKVCTAFDEGQTFVQVKATAGELVARVPLTTVHAGADDYVVRTVVALYCPAHAPKLV